MEAPPMADPDALSHRLASFVQRNWLTLAATAWQNYMKFGRGYTLFDWVTIESWDGRSPVAFQPPYVTESGDRRANEIISRYDPQTSIVIAVTTDSRAAQAADAHVLEPPPGVAIINVGESLGIWMYGYDP